MRNTRLQELLQLYFSKTRHPPSSASLVRLSIGISYHSNGLGKYKGTSPIAGLVFSQVSDPILLSAILISYRRWKLSERVIGALKIEWHALGGAETNPLCAVLDPVFPLGTRSIVTCPVS